MSETQLLISVLGYQNGTVSRNNVALNGFGDPTIVSINNSTFDFDSADLTGAFRSGSILVEGFSNGILKYSQSVSVNTTTPTLFNFNFFGIDKLEFLGVDGKDTNDTYSNQGKQFALDDFTYNDHETKSIPEPSAIQALAVLGLEDCSLGEKLQHNLKLFVMPCSLSVGPNSNHVRHFVVSVCPGYYDCSEAELLGSARRLM